MECATANSLEIFAADALEGGTVGERLLFEDCELTGESDTREGEAPSKCSFSYTRDVDVLTEYHTHQIRQRVNAFSGMLSSLGHPERSTRRRERHSLKASLLFDSRAVRLRHPIFGLIEKLNRLRYLLTLIR